MAVEVMARDTDYGAFVEKFILQPVPSPHQLPLSGLTFAIKDIFDVEGYVTGFGHPEWVRTHSAATSTAPAVLAVLGEGRCHMYCINGENIHYGTPTNPCAPDRIPGGSSSGSAVAVGAKLVDFSLGTDTGGSVRVPASYCGIYGFRPSIGAVSTAGVIPMSQFFDTVGWFARDPTVLKQVGHVLLESSDTPHVRPSQVIVAEDCVGLSSIPSGRTTQVLLKAVEKLFGGHIIKNVILGDYVKDKVPSLKNFISEGNKDQETIPSLAALSRAMRLLQRYEVKKNHGDWVTTVKPEFGPGIHEQVWEAMRTSPDNIDACQSMRTELRAALTALLGDSGIFVYPTVRGPPPKLKMDAAAFEVDMAKAFSLLAIAGVSGFCQVSIPLGMYDNLPVSVSLVAKHGSDGFLLNLVSTLHDTLKEEIQVAERTSY
ncbi:hypothetical protein Patl1_22686 [Pistacia atlantica]|uniref:Uncharacterized protein n=1 Tax=Pistacia atlantica TaxID=434234 RepID=A0ACC0ZUU4_9ROSI|nr:hypothetical protein Patl1_22686 [Pistacia atlantica]